MPPLGSDRFCHFGVNERLVDVELIFQALKMTKRFLVARVLVGRFSLRVRKLVMHLIRETKFWCETCAKNIFVKVYCDDSNAVSEGEEKKALGLIMQYHQIELHTMCWKCDKQIRSHEIAGMNWVRKKVWENLCGECV